MSDKVTVTLDMDHYDVEGGIAVNDWLYAVDPDGNFRGVGWVTSIHGRDSGDLAGLIAEWRFDAANAKENNIEYSDAMSLCAAQLEARVFFGWPPAAAPLPTGEPLGTCPKCKGTGTVLHPFSMEYGPCLKCNGTGQQKE